MDSKYSIWLRETTRLYLRYMAVGLIGVPLALLYSWARHADWKMPVVTGALILVGLIGAFYAWRRLGNWQVVPDVMADASRDAWADLVNAALRTRVPPQQLALCVQQSMRPDEEQIRAWNLLLTAAVASPIDRPESVDATPKNPPPQPMMTTEQQQDKQSTQTEHVRQRQPAWAMALRGQTQNAHGLA
jgi:hypothetical protein